MVFCVSDYMGLGRQFLILQCYKRQDRAGPSSILWGVLWRVCAPQRDYKAGSVKRYIRSAKKSKIFTKLGFIITMQGSEVLKVCSCYV